MGIVFVILPLTLLLAICAIGAFIWAVRRDQFDDMQTPAMRMLFEDNPEKNGDKKASSKEQ